MRVMWLVGKREYKRKYKRAMTMQGLQTKEYHLGLECEKKYDFLK